MDVPGVFFYATGKVPSCVSETTLALKGKPEVIFLALLACLAIIPIWWLPYFVTGDGPAHLYNSAVLLDMLKGKHTAFYQKYFEFNISLYPNWFSTVALVLLQFVFSPLIAEKILLSVLAILFPVSALFFVRSFNRQSSPLALLLLPFVCHYLFYYGFFNYCFGICFSLLYLGIWWRMREGEILLQLLLLLPLGILLYFTHAFGLLLLAFVLPPLFAVEAIALWRKQDRRATIRVLVRRWSALAVSMLPVAMFMYRFVKSNSSEAQYFPETTDVLWKAFSTLQVLQIFSDNEKLPTALLVVLLTVLPTAAIVWRIKSKQNLQAADGLLLSAILFVVVFFVQPYSLCLGGFWIPRISWMPWLMLVLWLNTFSLPKAVTYIAGAISTIVFLWLLFLRFPYQQKVSLAEEDYLSVSKYIKPGSTVLPLSYSHYGMDETGTLLTNRIWLFRHAFDYIGATTVKPVVNLANYQAATTWFALRWKNGCNPYEVLGRNNNIEGQPPEVILNAGNNCSLQPEYVVTWCRKFSYTDTYQWRSVNEQLQSGYKRVYQSPTQRTELWQLR